ncbi:hypothetical protein [Arenicella xantha]|uniref:Uncharacterized protein n=1 Tax=Arenicella xantha TaxID=644221 RepID=A0A395JPI2_9GAMM|nr:hypothetical protein [Arenicella xantha]RBP51488.1 hypothetical protein DFR28_102918 [Arenicella xantha]
MKKISVLAVSLMAIATSFTASAEPRSVAVDITKMRPYASGNYFVTVSSDEMNDSSNCTLVYKVQSDAAGAKSVIASLLTAYALEKPIEIEIPTSTGCEGFGTPIQSVFLSQ